MLSAYLLLTFWIATDSSTDATQRPPLIWGKNISEARKIRPITTFTNFDIAQLVPCLSSLCFNFLVKSKKIIAQLRLSNGVYLTQFPSLTGWALSKTFLAGRPADGVSGGTETVKIKEDVIFAQTLTM